MSDLVQVFFVVSFRNHRTGQISHQIESNLEEMPRGSRQVFGTGHTSHDIVMSRLQKCRDGVWFKEQHKSRTARQREDDQCRQRLHQKFLREQRKRRRRDKVTS